jgi:hypothetical protein
MLGQVHGLILLCGDLNARTGGLSRYLLTNYHVNWILYTTGFWINIHQGNRTFVEDNLEIAIKTRSIEREISPEMNSLPGKFIWSDEKREIYI